MWIAPRLFLAAALLPVPVLAADKDEDSKVICKKDASAELGSRVVSRKVCMTRADWRLQEAAAQRTMRSIDDRSRRTPAPEPR